MNKTNILAEDRRSGSDLKIYDAHLINDEGYFRNMLQLEMKRSERSKRSFVLMLIDISPPLECDEAAHVVGKVVNQIVGITRETDIKGWLTPGEVLGIIFIENNRVSGEYCVKKVKDSLRELLSPLEHSFLKISTYEYPRSKSMEEDVNADTYLDVYEDVASNHSLKRVSIFCKRCIDVAGSLLGILLFLPVFLIVPVLIKLTSKGAVFFRQVRIGQDGRKFTLLKFRTMQENNNDFIHKEFVRDFIHNSSVARSSGNGQVYKITNDPRITGIGRLLRKASLDEVPQFINVLHGDMSLVGPRPATPYEVEEYDNWHRKRVAGVKPGITGFWQVYGRSRTDFNNMVRMDIQYIKTWSPLMDILLILKTPFALLSAKGAY